MRAGIIDDIYLQARFSRNDERDIYIVMRGMSTGHLKEVYKLEQLVENYLNEYPTEVEDVIFALKLLADRIEHLKN